MRFIFNWLDMNGIGRSLLTSVGGRRLASLSFILYQNMDRTAFRVVIMYASLTDYNSRCQYGALHGSRAGCGKKSRDHRTIRVAALTCTFSVAA